MLSSKAYRQRPPGRAAGIAGKNQQGLAAVEFAVLGAVFFMLLLGIIETGRMLFMWNMLDEITRRGARLAAVCPVSATSQAAVRQRAILDGSGENWVPAGAVDIRYLALDGTEVTDPVAGFQTIRFVRVAIDPNQYQFRSAFFPAGLVIAPPTFRTTLPSESLGAVPNGATPGNNPIPC